MKRLMIRRRWRLGVAGAAAALLMGPLAGPGSAGLVGTPDLIGSLTVPFEEGGAETPMCTGEKGDLVCKPVGQAVAPLKDGRIFYFNGIEGQENVQHGTVPDLGPEMINSQARVLDLRDGRPQWTVPAHPDGGAENPDVKPGHKGTDDPFGMAGVPGKPGDGLVGSAWGSAGLPPQNSTSSPDDAGDNDADMFCADVVSLGDGRVAVVGGSDWYAEPFLMERRKGDPVNVGVSEVNGLRNVRLFNPDTNDFDQIANMKYQRWYPSGVVLSDGKLLAVGGVTKLVKSTQLSNIRRSETWDPATNTWTENYTGPESENSLPQQPRLFLTPNGKVFYGGAGQSWVPAGQAIDEATWALQQFFDPQTKKWEVVGVNPLGVHDTAMSVPLPMEPPYDKMSILTFGGAWGPSPGSYAAVPLSSVTTVDAQGKVTTELTGKLNQARWFPSGVALPDGKVIATTGARVAEPVMPGSEVPVKMMELYDPATGTWTELFESHRGRTYHNTAALLPDGRVLIGGHSPVGAFFGPPNSGTGDPLPNNDKDPSFEVYSPPYLHWGPRPSIASVQAGIRWGETFTIGSPQAADIKEVVLMRMGSVQHVNDNDVRTLRLAFEPTKDGLSATAPPNGVAAPPGYYYLFINRADEKGRGVIPSVARIVHIGDTSDPAPAVQPMPDDPAAPEGGSANPDAQPKHDVVGPYDTLATGAVPAAPVAALGAMSAGQRRSRRRRS